MNRATQTLIGTLFTSVVGPIAFGQAWNYGVAGSATCSGNFTASADFSGTLIGNYDQTTNPTGTRTLNYSIFGTRPAAPTNISKTMSGTGGSSGSFNSAPTGSYRLEADASANTIRLSLLSTNLIGTSPRPTFPVNATVTYQSFLTAAPNNSYPFLVPLSVPLGNAEIVSIVVAQNAAASGAMTSTGTNTYNFSVTFPATITADIIIQGSQSQSIQTQDVTATGTINTATGAASLTMNITNVVDNQTPTPLPPNSPFDLAPATGTGEPAHLLLSLTINRQQSNTTGNSTLPGTPSPVCFADINNDGGVDSDDVIAFFSAWDASSMDYTGDGGTDGDDIIAFFGDWDSGC